MRIWTNAVTNAVCRHVANTGSTEFTRQELIAAEIDAIAEETQTTGVTPTQTMTRVLQYLRDAGLVAFLAPGRYRWLGNVPDSEPMVPSKAVFVLDAVAADGEQPERVYRFQSRWLATARRTAGQWIIYQAAAGYHAVARVEAINPDQLRAGEFWAQIADCSYLEFGRTVPLQPDGRVMERSLIGAGGSLDGSSVAQSIRAISNEEFNLILELGLITDEDLLPRSDVEDEAVPLFVEEERIAWEGLVDRATMLASRKVRNQQFRKRVLDAYGATCALTGMKLINGGGRAETEAAHIMSVEAGGPDAVSNGIALSGTIHWMFDRGLISLSDTGDILLSRAINDRDSVERLIYPDRKARFPLVPTQRPHPRYLDWHRTECFHD